METDPASLDPEERMNRWYALASVALGVISFCLAMVPACGASASLLGMFAGYHAMKSDSRTLALVGLAISALSFLLTVIYAAFRLLFASTG